MRPPSRSNSRASACVNCSGSLTVLQSGTKVAATIAGLRPGWNGAIDCATMQMGKGDAVLGAGLPSGLRRLQLGFALVEMQDAVAAQHVACTGRREHQRRFGRGQRHQRRLRGGARAHAVAPTGAPEAQQPWSEARQVTGPDRQRPQRIQQPARCVAQDPRRGERQDVRERQRAGVTAAGLRRHALPIDQPYVAAFALQSQRDRHADDAGADHQYGA